MRIGGEGHTLVAELLTSRDESTRNRAIYTLHGAGSAALPLLPTLLKRLHTPNNESQHTIIISEISHIGPQGTAAIPDLVKIALTKSTPYTATSALRALGVYGVALVPQNPGGYTHPAQVAAVHQAGRHLAAAGYAVEEIAPPDLDAVVDTWHCIGSTDVLALLAPQMEEYGDPDAQTSMRLWRELAPPSDLRGVLGALAQRDLLLWRWLEFMQRYPLVVMPTMGDLAPSHNLDTTREGQARVLDAIRVSLISPVLGIPALAVPVGNQGHLRPGVQILAPRFREDLCLDAGEVIEAAEGVVTPIDPVPSSAR